MLLNTVEGGGGAILLLSPRGHLAMSADIFGCHRGTPVYWVGARDAAKHPTTQRTVPKPRVLQLKLAKVRRLRRPAMAPSRVGLHGGGVEAVVLKKKRV